ncbi:MAG: hypothetical protein IKA02_00145, partial [Clostridia bacterium]|nr:hypothetical protein [Clostridia bacterium]
ARLNNSESGLVLDDCGRQYFCYYNKHGYNDQENFNAYTLPAYEPQYNEFPLSMIIAYMLDKILTSKCKRFSQFGAFNDKNLELLKDGLTKQLDVALDYYPHVIIQSKLFK